MLIVVVSAANLWWIRRDVAPMPHPNDPYIYLSNTLAFVDQLRSDGFDDLSSSLSRLSFKGRSPLYQLLTVPFILVFGRSLDAALSINVVFVAVLLISVYAIGRVVASGRAGLIAAVVVASYPPVIHLSRIYRPHGMLPVFTALSVLSLLLLLRDRTVRRAWTFGASLAAGVLLHPTFLYVLAAPTLVFGSYVALCQTAPRRPATLLQAPSWLGGKLRDPLVTRGLLPAALLVLATALPWYLTEGWALYDLASYFSSRPKPYRAGFFDRSRS